jgi:hypothetical protein
MRSFLLVLFCLLALLSVGLFANISPLNMDAGVLYAQF